MRDTHNNTSDIKSEIPVNSSAGLELERFWQKEYQIRKDAVSLIIDAYGKGGLTTDVFKKEVSALYNFLNTGKYE